MAYSMVKSQNVCATQSYAKAIVQTQNLYIVVVSNAEIIPDTRYNWYKKY